MAGKLDTGETSINEFATELEGRGHTVLEKWWQTTLQKPYLDHPQTSQVAAERMIRAARDCEVCILFPEDNILGAAVEFGAALASTAYIRDKQIIVVNPFEVRQSVFYAHPAVIAVESLQAIRQQPWY